MASPPLKLTNSFAGILIGDAIDSLERWGTDQSQRNSRDLVRTIFAALDGLTWLFRQHVVSTAIELESISNDERQALSEMSYQVTAHGTVSRQARFIPLPAMIRIVTRIASTMHPNLEIRFDGLGWDQFRKATAIRNRITHPKSEKDMALAEREVATCIAAFDWLLDAATKAMEAANTALDTYNHELRRLIADLEADDPQVWAEYRAVAAELGR